MVHKIEAAEFGSNEASSKKLTQSVLQITEMLAMYQAELARILQLQCSDIGRLANGKDVIKPYTVTWERAVLFLCFYEQLYNQMEGDAVAMRHWLRVESSDLNGVPLLLIVDDDQLDVVLKYIKLHEIKYGK